MAKPISQQLFDSFKDGDEAAFRQIMSDCSLKLYTFIQKMVKSREDTEEIAQDVFMEMWEKKDGIPSAKDFHGYLFSSARYKALHLLRKSIPEIPVSNNEIQKNEADLNIASELDAKELEFIILLIVEQMPKQRKKVFLMSRYEGLSRAEISEKLNISPHTVSQHLRMAKEDIRKVIVLLAIFLFFLR